ncbi:MULTISPECIES: DUF6468 domain-containing protein [Marinicauda]|jgi:hypothetical protein|uniref:DUF6468 domain-containing protein n=1 Tax=Marinicauda TaxID=1649466 RepID=UPI0022E22A1E|nr:DUF6468 domain-containing protein [Marinicauda sp. Alg238-R41]
MSPLVLIFEGLVAVLMLGAGVMCWRVDQRLKSLRNGQDGLKATIGALNDAVDRARASLAALDRASREQGADLKQRVEEARRMADELSILTSAGESRAERLAQAPRRREMNVEPGRPVRPREPRQDDRPASAEPASGRLLEALKTLR